MSLSKLTSASSAGLLGKCRHVFKKHPASSHLLEKKIFLLSINKEQYFSTENKERNDRNNNQFFNLNYKLLFKLSILGLGAIYGYQRLQQTCTPKKLSKRLQNLVTINAADPIHTRRTDFNFIADVVRLCESSVVSIEKNTNAPFVKKSETSGSGFIVDAKGLIISNAHVVGNQSTVTVRYLHHL